MPTLAPDALPARLAAEPLRPAYLIAGAETLLVLEAADAVRAAARERGCSERETFEADARGFDWNAPASQINAPSLFSAKRLLELHLPTGKPGKEGAALIEEF
jgi:DNA polymerase-3 subunit delta